MTDFDPYQILEVPCDADLETIEKAYRRAAMLAHPDRGGATEQMQAVNEAWEILKDPERRKRFDETGDRSAEDPMVKAARGLMENMVAIIVRNSAPDLDIVEALRQGIGKQREQCQAERMKTLGQIRDLEHRLTRLRGPKEKNFIRLVIETEIEKGKARLPVYDADEKTLAKALELLKEYGWVGAWSWSSPTVLQPMLTGTLPTNSPY